MIVPGYDTPITTIITSTYIDGVTTGYIMPNTIGATSTVSSPIRPIVSSGITTIAHCFATSEGTPWAPMSADPAEGIGATMGSSCSAEDAVTLVPLPNEMITALADSCRLTWIATLFFGTNTKGLRCLSML
jgi:hypothetical protein